MIITLHFHKILNPAHINSSTAVEFYKDRHTYLKNHLQDLKKIKFHPGSHSDTHDTAFASGDGSPLTL